MSEVTLQWIQGIKLLGLVAFAMLYGFGGVRGKWKRRIIGPCVLTAILIGVSLWVNTFNYWYASYALLLFAACSVGYGGSNLSNKIMKRARAGGLAALAALPIFIPNHAWLLLGLHILICVSVSTVLGVWNPTKSARAEETAIGASYVLIPLFTI